MRFGILVPQTGPWPVLRERCLEVERLGYDSLWIGDHYFLEPLPHFELFEAMTVLGGIAVSIPRVRFGAMTTNVIYRNPAVIAKQAATLDQMSGGRFELGLGAGVYETDHRMTGSAPWSPRERVDRFEEILAVVDPLLRGERVDHDGAYYRVEGGLVRPRPIQEPRPPITVGATGPRMIRLAAQRADRWNTLGGRGLSAEELWSATAEQVGLFNDAVSAAGRDQRPSTGRSTSTGRSNRGRRRPPSSPSSNAHDRSVLTRSSSPGPGSSRRRARRLRSTCSGRCHVRSCRCWSDDAPSTVAAPLIVLRRDDGLRCAARSTRAS